jgi:hypothetical protein
LPFSAYQDFDKNYGLSPDALRVKIIVEYFKEEGSFDGIQGVEWVCNSNLDDLINKDCFKKLEPRIQVKLLCALVRIKGTPLNLSNNPILYAILECKTETIVFLLLHPYTNKLELDKDQNNIFHYLLGEILVRIARQEPWSSSVRRLYDAICRCNEKTILLKQRNSNGQTPLMCLIRGIGFQHQIDLAIELTRKDGPSALFQLIREDVTQASIASLKSLVSSNRLRNWKRFGFDIDSAELALVILIYKGLPIRYKKLISKVFLHEIVGWV